MFHVKHPTPEVIALNVGALLEEFAMNALPSPARSSFVERMTSFAALLALWGARFNLTAEPENPDEIAFHIIDSLMPLVIARREPSPLSGAFAPNADVLDLGSGAGFPGLILAAASEARFRLVESRRRRVNFLNAALDRMGLVNVTIDPTHRADSDFLSDFDTVTARAFGPPPEFYRIAARALRPGGCAILYANPEQPLVPEKAADAGLAVCRRIPYELARRGSVTRRILAIWRKG